MKPMDLFDELTYVDEAFILEAHETPAAGQTHFCFCRVGALLAAVIAVVAMSVAVVATMTEDLDFRVQYLWRRYVDKGIGYMGLEGNTWIELDSVAVELDDREAIVDSYCAFTPENAKVFASCDNETLEIKLEAMILMEDGQVHYLQNTVQGEGTALAQLGNLISGNEGTLIHVRHTILVHGQVIEAFVYPKTRYLPPTFGFRIPVGTDPRFPDMKENYDGRAEPQVTEPIRETEARTILPEGEGIVIVIEEPTE